MDVLDYIAYETERQSGTAREALGMYRAYTSIIVDWQLRKPITVEKIAKMGELITGAEGFRKVPAVFNQGMPAVDARLIDRAMDNLVNAINENVDDWADLAPFFVKEFLLIHPFADGNGRVGSLLWNILNNSLSNPTPMPFFFGDN